MNKTKTIYKLRSLCLNHIYVGSLRIFKNKDTLVKELTQTHLQAWYQGLISITPFTPCSNVDQSPETAIGKDGKDGKDGVGIVSITLDSKKDLVDTYKIKLTNGTSTTFTVTNGKIGADGKNGKSAYELVVANGYKGTLKDWLDTMSKVETLPNSLKQILDASNEAKQVSNEAKELVDEVLHLVSAIEAPKDERGKLSYWISQMFAGKPVKIVCYGDSTTDGFSTTGYKQNVVGTNHNILGGKNAWPAQLQTLLREMFNNQNIVVYNAGVAGQRMDNGWAVANYDTWVTNNSLYTNPDIVFIGFGANDATFNKADIIQDHTAQTNLLIDKITSYGGLPILLTTNVIRVTTSESGRNKLQLVQQINDAKKSIALNRSIPLFDLHSAMKNWIAKNTEGYNYTDLQKDLTHWNDLGHKYQACWLASLLYNHTVNITDTNSYDEVYFLDSRANSIVSSDTVSTSSNTRIGISPYIASVNKLDCRNKALLDVWVWCEQPDASIVYRQILTDANDAGIKVTDVLTNTFYTKTAGFKGFKFNDYSAVDTPLYVGQLKYGLNRVQLIGESDQSSAVLFGFFDFVSNYQGKPVCKNMLMSSGTFRESKVLNAPDKNSVRDTSLTFAPDTYDAFGKNVIQLFNKDYVCNIALEGKFAKSTGVMLVQSNGRKKGELSGIMLSGFPNSVTIYTHRYTIETGDVNYDSVGKAAPVKADDSGLFRLLLKAYFHDEGYPVIDIYNNDSLSQTVSWKGIDYLPTVSGVAGNIYRYQSANGSSNKSVEISKFEVWYEAK